MILMRRLLGFVFLVSPFFLFGQDPNPVDRKVANPISDVPVVSPISNETRVGSKRIIEPEGGDGEIVIYSDKTFAQGEPGKRIVIHEGNVDIRLGIYRLQADKVTLYEDKNLVIAEGNVVFDQGEDQRITGTKAEWNYKTKLGYFINSTGFTNQTSDGTIIYFTADRVERVALDEIVVINGKFTACEEAVPQWSFTAERASIKLKDRVKLKNPRFRVRDVPIIALPVATISIKERNRQSGFLTPTFGFSANKGFRISNAYYQTLGRSADATLRLDVYTLRGIGVGLDVRTRANERSYFNFGFYAVKDRIFTKESKQNPDQGGTLVYAEGVHYFPNGFVAGADVRLTSNLAFRQVFSDTIQQIISPIEVSKAFLNKSWNSYTLNILGKSETISIPNVRIKTRSLPSVNFEKRPTRLSFLRNVYFSFKSSLEGISRREEVDDLVLYRQIAGSDPIVTPAIAQRFDLYPQVSLPVTTKYFDLTLTGAVRFTYYSNSLDQLRRVISKNLIRKYGEFEIDFRPVALAKNYYGKSDVFKFRHTIEPYVIYRFVKGVDNFNRIIRFDYQDTITDTNEIEYGITNRIFVRRYAEAVTEEAQERLRKQKNTSDDKPLSIQPYEIFTLTLRQKYFFDETFGEAFVPGRRNQIASITGLTFYTFGGKPRRFSPISIDATYRPRRVIFVNTRMDLGVEGEGVRALSATLGYDTRLLKIFQTFYYTQSVKLPPQLQMLYGTDKEPGTLRGSQWNPSIFIGNRDRGWFGGTSLFFDFQNTREKRVEPLVSSSYTLGYASKCCALAVQAFTYNVGIRRENRFVFSFRLNGIGSFGTESFGQGIR
ncbi:MAG: LPS-assembly protein LptD [Acidobacteria bacterium]|nr:MAG: LPS-assembly protein LptD [Acidobacteriota bacterium]